jgi:hypothetical protein
MQELPHVLVVFLKSSVFFKYFSKLLQSFPHRMQCNSYTALFKKNAVPLESETETEFIWTDRAKSEDDYCSQRIQPLHTQCSVARRNVPNSVSTGTVRGLVATGHVRGRRVGALEPRAAVLPTKGRGRSDSGPY